MDTNAIIVEKLSWAIVYYVGLALGSLQTQGENLKALQAKFDGVVRETE